MRGGEQLAITGHLFFPQFIVRHKCFGLSLSYPHSQKGVLFCSGILLVGLTSECWEAALHGLFQWAPLPSGS
jgi:hypothetical protein